MENLYIHVPFCSRKCDYCAFYSVTGSNRALWTQWLDRVCRDLEQNHSRLQNLRTLYFGGGTPTLPEPDFLDEMFSRIMERITLQNHAEITTEANPETITREKAAVLGKYVNRVSMGVQSFQEEKRRVLGRYPETAANTRPALRALRDAGIKNIGFDLMYAVPGETLADWQEDLKRAADEGIEHLSAYALTPEENTPYALEHGLQAADDELASDMWHAAAEILAGYGMTRYEISNYAKKGFEAAHNCNVWSGGTYLGLGPSATSFDGTDRWTECDDLLAWLSGKTAAFDRIPRDARIREILIMGLRTTAGWPIKKFSTATGCDSWCGAEKILCQLQDQGLIEFDHTICRATESGLEFWNHIAEQLII